MDNKYLYFIGGFITGSLAAGFLVHKYEEKKLLDELKKQYEYTASSEVKSIPISNETLEKKLKSTIIEKVDVNATSEKPRVAYNKPGAPVIKDDTVALLSDMVGDSEQNSDEPVISNIKMETPVKTDPEESDSYIVYVTEEELNGPVEDDNGEEDEYDTIEYVLCSDKVILDERGEILNDDSILATIGSNYEKEFENTNEPTLYVRNHRLKLDIIVTKVNSTFSEYLDDQTYPNNMY